jgi:hypothetical protein
MFLQRILTRRGASRANYLLRRLRFETGLAISPLAQILDQIRHPGLRYLHLDVPRINTLFPAGRRQEVARATADALKNTDRLCYFQNLAWYNWRHRHLPRGIPALDDLYPPNLAVLDFLEHHVRPSKNEVLLDFACGIGTLLVYERDLGFARLYGFDRWVYLARPTAERFLRRFGLDGSVLVELEDLASLPVTVITCVGFPLAMLMEASDVWSKPSVRYLLADRMSRPVAVPGFRRTGEYGRLLTVFEK